MIHSRSHADATSISLDAEMCAIPHGVFRVRAISFRCLSENFAPFIPASILDSSSVKGDAEVRSTCEVDCISPASCESCFWCDRFNPNHHGTNKQSTYSRIASARDGCIHEQHLTTFALLDKPTWLHHLFGGLR